MGRRARTAAAIAAAVLLSALNIPGAAAQTFRGSVSSTETVTSGSWGASASPGTMTWSVGGGTRETATVTNSGSIALTGLTYKVTVSAGTGTTTFTLEVCARAFNGGGNCPGGGATAIGGSYALGSVTTVSSSLVPSIGGVIYLEASASNAVTSTVTMTLQVSVSSSTQIRSAVVSNQ